MNLSMDLKWILALLGLLGLLWGLSLLLVRFFTRRQILKDMVLAGEAVEFKLPFIDPRPEDQEALSLIRRVRRRYLLKWWPGTAFSFRAIHELSLDLVRDIAHIYYPDRERPELTASLADLVALHNRVGSRLAAWLETFPMRPFKDVELGTILKAHEFYQTVISHPGFTFIKNYRLDKIVRWGITAYNYANPWHWGGRAAFHGGKEVAIRLLLARIVDLVGEESIILYGRLNKERGQPNREQLSPDQAVLPP